MQQLAHFPLALLFSQFWQSRFKSDGIHLTRVHGLTFLSVPLTHTSSQWLQLCNVWCCIRTKACRVVFAWQSLKKKKWVSNEVLPPTSWSDVDSFVCVCVGLNNSALPRHLSSVCEPCMLRPCHTHIGISSCHYPFHHPICSVTSCLIAVHCLQNLTYCYCC